jgi:hypothetical protein
VIDFSNEFDPDKKMTELEISKVIFKALKTVELNVAFMLQSFGDAGIEIDKDAVWQTLVPLTKGTSDFIKGMLDDEAGQQFIEFAEEFNKEIEELFLVKEVDSKDLN